MEKLTHCMFCQKPIPAHQEKHLVANLHVDIPVSHLIACADCAAKATESKYKSASISSKN